MRRRIRSQRTRPFWLRRDSARCRAALLGSERAAAPVCSWARRNIGCAHAHACNHLPSSGMGFVHPSLKLGFHLIQLRLQPFAYRLPQHRVPSIAPLLHTDVREAKKLNVSGFPSSRFRRSSIANGPNSSSRVFSGCSSRWNFFIRSVSSARN